MNQIQRTNRRSCFIGCLALLIGPVLFAICFMGFLAMREGMSRGRLQSKVAKLQAAGIPVDNASMAKFYDSRTSPEDTQAWLNVFAKLDSVEFVDATRRLPLLGNNNNNNNNTDVVGESNQDVPAQGAWANEAEVRAFLTGWQPLQQEIESLAKRGEPVRFPIGADSIPERLDYYQKVRTAARWMLLAGKVAIRDRDSRQLRSTIESISGMSQIISGDPILMTQSTVIAIDGISIGLLQEALEQDALETEDLKVILESTRGKCNVTDSWKDSSVGERGYSLPLIAKHSWFASSDAAAILDLYDRLEKLPTEPLDEFDRSFRTQSSLMKERSSSSWSPFSPVLVMSAMSVSSDQFVRQAMQHRIASLAIGVRLYEDKHRKMPDALSDLAEFQLDASKLIPIGSKPFGYRVIPEGSILWGFSSRSHASTPDEPPPIDEDIPEEAQFWRWLLRSKP